MNSIKRFNYIAKRQKAAKELKFGNYQNSIDHTISTKVEYKSELIIPSEHAGDLEDIIQHDVVDDSNDRNKNNKNEDVIDENRIDSLDDNNQIQEQDTDNDHDDNSNNDIID